MGSNGGVRGVTNAPTDSLASGRWSVREVFRAVKDSSWPIAFNPAALSPVLWLDASDTSTITESSGAVSQWNNKGTLGNFTQATGALQPTTGATTLNGLNVMDFAADYLTAANTNEWKFLHDGTKYVIAVAWRAGTNADPNALYGLLGSGSTSNIFSGVDIFYDDRASASRNDMIAHNVRNGSTTTVDNRSNNIFAANTFAVTTIVGDPGNGTAANRSEIYRNTGTALKENTSSASPSTSNPSFALQIGATGGNNFPLTGSVGEIVIVSGANATETNRVLLRDYLTSKWAVS
jgi:hypothetical protein